MTNSIIHITLMIFMPPLLLGIIAKTKAAFAGRTGAPYLQPYYDIFRLLRKGSVFSDTTTAAFQAGPIVTLAATFTAGLLMPLGNHPSPLSFSGDLLMFAYLFSLARFFTTTAALDTGSSFEGMGAAREATFACLAEPALFFGLAVLARQSGSYSLSTMLIHSSPAIWLSTGASMLLLVGAFFIIFLAENCRIPFDDPNTHLELTMIHEVMVLDHSGPLLGYIHLGAALKLFLFGALLTQIALPVRTGNQFADWGIFIISMVLLAIITGIVESVMARLRLLRIPYLLITACILAAFSLLLILR